MPGHATTDIDTKGITTGITIAGTTIGTALGLSASTGVRGIIAIGKRIDARKRVHHSVKSRAC